MVLNFIGAVELVRERQREFVSEVLEDKGYKNCDVLVEPVGKAGDNFVASVARLTVNQNGETFKMVAKIGPLVRDMLNVDALFGNENVMYTEVFPKFKELQKSAGIPEEEWFRHAECYGTLMETPDEIILLEDLKETNFEILNKFEPMSTECVKLTLKNFATYHSLSYVLKQQEPETFDNLKSKFASIYDGPSQLIAIRTQYGFKLENDVLASLDDERQKEAFKGTISKILDLIAELKESQEESKYTVIQQGDGWTNNIMFTHENNQPTQCVLIDYQMTKESNPMYDIMYMLFNSMESEQLVKQYTDLINFYYNELDKSLRNFGLKASDVYPRKQLDFDMKRNSKLILAISIIITNLIIKDGEEANKMQEALKNGTEVTDMMSLMMERTIETDVLFGKKIRGLAKSFIELGLL